MSLQDVVEQFSSTSNVYFKTFNFPVLFIFTVFFNHAKGAAVHFIGFRAKLDYCNLGQVNI